MQMQYFNIKEFDCQETGANDMNPFFLEKLDQLRHKCGFPFSITSGYRDPSHSIEARKTRPGTHARGIAADIHINSGSEGYVIVSPMRIPSKRSPMRLQQCLRFTRRKSHWLRSKSTKQKQKETGSKQDGDQQPVGFASWDLE